MKKTKHMVVSPVPSVPMDESVLLRGTKLDSVHSFNYLDVVIDDKLTFNNFVKEKCNKVNLRIYQFSMMRKYITCDIANLICKQTILPISEYADLMMESGPKSDVNKLQDLQDPNNRYCLGKSTILL